MYHLLTDHSFSCIKSVSIVAVCIKPVSIVTAAIDPNNHIQLLVVDGDKILAERGFDPRTSGLWAQHASTAPLC